MLPGVLIRCTERGHRSLPVEVEAVPPFCVPSILPLYSAEKPVVL